MIEKELLDRMKMDAETRMGNPTTSVWHPEFTTLSQHVLLLLEENAKLNSAIGVCVPGIIRCFIRQTESDLDRELATSVLERIVAVTGNTSDLLI